MKPILISDNLAHSSGVCRSTPPSTRKAAPLCRKPVPSSVDDHVGDLIGRREASEQRRGSHRLQEVLLGLILRDALGFRFAFIQFDRISEFVGPGRTALTVTPVPATHSATPREIASCAVFVMP